MKFHRYEDAAKWICSIASKKSTLRILEHVLIEQKNGRVRYLSTDLEQWLELSLPCWSTVEGSFVIPSSVFAKLKEKVVTSVEDCHARLGKVLVSYLSAEEFPIAPWDFSTWTEDDAFTIDRTRFLATLSRLVPFTSSDHTRMALTGICFRSGLAMATDGHRACLEELPDLSPALEERIVPTLLLSQLGEAFHLDRDLDCSVVQPEKDGPKYLYLSGTGFRYATKFVEGPYPNLQNVIPKESAGSIVVDVGMFLHAVKDASPFLNPKTRLLVLSLCLTPGILMLRGKDIELGVSYEDELPAKLTWPEDWDAIAVNAEYLANILVHCPRGEITLVLPPSPLGPIRILTRNPHLGFILMPLRRLDEDKLPSPASAEPLPPPDTTSATETPSDSSQAEPSIKDAETAAVVDADAVPTPSVKDPPPSHDEGKPESSDEQSAIPVEGEQKNAKAKLGKREKKKAKAS